MHRPTPLPWLAFRAKPADENPELEQHVSKVIRLALSGCLRCGDIFEQTGGIPLYCPQCRSTRDRRWLEQVEALAEADLQVLEKLGARLEVPA